MSRNIKIYSGSSGLNTKLDPARIKFDSRTGVSDLTACMNCDIDDSGRISRRGGYATTARTESWENLFGCGNYGLGTKGNALCVIESDMSYTALRNVTTGAKMSWVRDTDGTQDIIYYCNNYEKGRVINKVSYSWPLIVPVGVVTIKEFFEAPIGHILSIRNGRMFIAQNNILWYSEPNTYYAYRLGANFFGFSSRLRMIQAVSSTQEGKGGLWISDSESIYWFGGNIMPTAREMPLQVKVADYPAIENTAVKLPGSRVGEGLQGEVVVFTTPKGIIIGDSNGNLLNITERKVDLPNGLTGAGLYKDGKYIVTIN
ncbi:MAG: hypothetical protein Q7J15_08070 [Candidatus Desulfaltia sp.]|nr:hypothetical protein [Candidatus Desulfaltia sp.]